VKVIHAGLECGVFLRKYPNLDMISFGPTLEGVHSPSEKVNIPSADRTYELLIDIIENV
jgi:dipeptidase D